MRTFLIYCSMGLLAGLLQASVSRAASANVLADGSLTRLEQRLTEIDAELAQLASYSLRSGTGAVGYQSKSHAHAHNKEWIRIDLEQEWPVDQIVLVPTIRRDPKTGLHAEAFPAAFRILAGTGHTTHELATFTTADRLLPRIAPLAVSFPSVDASWISVEATILSPRKWDHKYALQLSEIMVFSGPENVAMHKPVSASSTGRRDEARDERFLVDGFVPYLMDSARESGSQAVAFRTTDPSQQVILTIDLETPSPVNQINLHLTDQSHTIPEAAPSDYAAPRHLRASGANRPDFSDETILFEYRQNSIYDVGPIIIRRFPETTCRYIRIHVPELYSSIDYKDHRYSVGFSEIEVLSKGRNISQGRPVSCSGITRPRNAMKRMTDGKNFLGEILPIRDWINQLARRHDLEAERPRIEAELNRHYARQKENLNRMAWLATLLTAGIIFTILSERSKRQRAIAKTRERIAANLHDELGANLHAIGILGDLAKAEAGANEHLKELLTQIRSLTTRTGAAARHCTSMLEAVELCEDLVAEMKRSSARLLADTQHDIGFEGEEFIRRLSPRKRIDLLLFYKESLTNIVRHASATQVRTRLIATPRKLQLTIEDNGQGMSSQIPASLTRRARLLGATVRSSAAEWGGTKISLDLKLLRGRFR